MRAGWHRGVSTHPASVSAGIRSDSRNIVRSRLFFLCGHDPIDTPIAAA